MTTDIKTKDIVDETCVMTADQEKRIQDLEDAVADILAGGE